MPHNPNKLFEDILQAVSETQTFCHGKTFHDFQEDRGLQLIVERELEIIGEALGRLRRDHPNLADQIRDIHKIIGLRNVLSDRSGPAANRPTATKTPLYAYLRRPRGEGTGLPRSFAVSIHSRMITEGSSLFTRHTVTPSDCDTVQLSNLTLQLR